MPETSADARFTACLEIVLAEEGGYVDNPADPGGATNLGITRRTLAAWRHVSPETALSKDAVMALTREEASEIYRANYWWACGGDSLPAGLDLVVFDYAANSGPARAIRALQAALGVAADGIVGPVTLGAVAARVRSGGLAALSGQICDARLTFLQRLTSFATFGRGWTGRVARIRQAALAMAGETSLIPMQRSNPMSILSGYRTYIVAALMVLVALAQLLGIELPAMQDQSAGHLLMEAFAVIFLRRGIENLGKA
jgi:lysozyme family protein